MVINMYSSHPHTRAYPTEYSLPCVFLPEKNNQQTQSPQGCWQGSEKLQMSHMKLLFRCGIWSKDTQNQLYFCAQQRFYVSHMQCIKKQGLGDSKFFQLLTIIFSKRIPELFSPLTALRFSVPKQHDLLEKACGQTPPTIKGEIHLNK